MDNDTKLAFINELKSHIEKIVSVRNEDIMILFERIISIVPMEPYEKDHRLWTNYCEKAAEQIKKNRDQQWSTK